MKPIFVENKKEFWLEVLKTLFAIALPLFCLKNNNKIAVNLPQNYRSTDSIIIRYENKLYRSGIFITILYSLITILFFIKMILPERRR